ncbi:MAG TPA: hypothetical protein VG672_24150, partial [Bryobacteraceae bacterium]|nr:hypothetical protein [Bryobacteraceae bacterium]
SLREIRLEGAQWNHPAGSPLLATGELTGTLTPLAGRIARTRLLPAADAALLEIAQADVGPVRLSGTATAIGKLEAEGLRAKLRQEPDGTWNAAAAAPRLQAAANTLLAAADASLAELRRVLSRLRGLFFLAAVLAALLVIGGKLLLLRIPAGLLRRLAIAALPVLLSLFLYALFFGSLSARSFILCAALAAIALAAGLEIAFYRHAAEWHERVEPLLLDLLAPLLILPLLAGYGFPVRLPAGIPRPTSLTIAHTELRDMAAGVDLAFCDTPVAAQARVSLATARNLQASFDPASLGIRSIIIDHAQVAGETDPVALQPLERLAYLPPAWKHAPRVAFCANATVGSGPLPEECEAAASGSQPSLDAAAAVDFDHLVARLTATVRSPGAGLHLVARADREGAAIEEVQSLPGSPVAIGGANGKVSWAGVLQSQFRLSRVQAGTAAANFSAGVLELDGNFPLSCQAGRSAFEARAREVRLSAPGGYEMAAEDARFSARLSAGRELSSTADLRAVHFLGRRPGESAPWLSGDLPLVHMGLRGRSSEGFPPHRLTGEVALAATRSNGEAVLRSSAPLRFSADLWRGALAVPAQSIALEQSIVSRIPSIPARMSLDGHLESLAPLRAQADAQIEIPHLSLAEPPVSAELNRLMLRASLRTPGSPFQLTYGSGWNRIVMPRLPASFELNEVSRLDAATEGSARNLPTWDALSADLDALGQWTRRNLPQISSEVSFRFAGSLPAAAGQPVLTAETSSGAGVRVDAVASTASRIELPDGRLTKAAVDTRATGIRTAKGAGDLSFAARSDLAGDAIGLEI